MSESFYTMKHKLVGVKGEEKYYQTKRSNEQAMEKEQSQKVYRF